MPFHTLRALARRIRSRNARRPSRKRRATRGHRFVAFGERLEERVVLCAVAVQGFTRIADGGDRPPAEVLEPGDEFGTSMTSLGDLDGDGVTDLAVGTPGDGTAGIQPGAVRILFMKANGTVKTHTKIAKGVGGLPCETPSEFGGFGGSVTSLGDLDGDGVNDLAVGEKFDDTGGELRGAVHILFLNADGTVKTNKKIADGIGGLPAGTLSDHGSFGGSLASLDDLDGNGVTDLAVGGLGGEVHVLFLQPNGTVKSHTRIADGVGGLPVGSVIGTLFGYSVTSLDDLDGNGVSDLAVGARTDSNGQGAVQILFMNADGTVDAHTKIADGVGGLPAGTLADLDLFGSSVIALGDLDDDGVVDLAVGADFDDTGGDDSNANRGAVYVLFMNADGTVKESTKIGDGTGGLPVNTLTDFDLFGSSVASPGDLNGDGVNDLAVGARTDGSVHIFAGAIYVLFMNADGTVKSHTKIADGLNGLDGLPAEPGGVLPPNTLEDRSGFGSSVATLGDLDGDGVTDLAVGSAEDNTGGRDHGAVHILFMNADDTVKAFTKIADGVGGLPLDLSREIHNFGASVAPLGDLDRDGNVDLAVGDIGRAAVHVLLLNDNGTIKSNSIIQLLGDSATDRFGSAMASLGDLDGDGVTDLAVGAPRGNDSGAVHLLFLNADGTLKSRTEIADGVGGLPTDTLLGGGSFGRSVTSPGDVDGDGVADLAVGAYDGMAGGVVHLLFLNSDGTVKANTQIDDGLPDDVLNNASSLGSSLTSAGDLDGNGVNDLAAGARLDSTSGTSRGAVHLLLLNADGTVKSTTKIADGVGGLPADTLRDFNYFGSSLSSLGDSDGDGWVELAVGAVNDDAGGESRGAVYILHLAFQVETDFGDAPDPKFPTLAVNDGARHIIGGPRLGSAVDAESDGQPSTDANGDDSDTEGDDEDGVTSISMMVATDTTSTVASVRIDAANTDVDSKLFGWIDFNRDGDWNDLGEQIFNNRNVVDGANVLSFTVPSTAVPGNTYARFRIGSEADLQTTGLAADGEIEDTLVTISDGDAPGGLIAQLDGFPDCAELQVSLVNGEVLVEHGTTEVFRAPIASTSKLTLNGTDCDDTLSTAATDAVFNLIGVDLRNGNNALHLTGSGQTLDLTNIPDSDIQGIESIVISGNGDNSLTLDAEEVVNISPTTNTLRVQHDDDDIVNYGGGWQVESPELVDGQFIHSLTQPGAAIQVVNTTAFLNPWSPLDSNRDGSVSAVDALIIINRLNTTGPEALPTPTSVAELVDFFYVDTNGDRFVAPVDVIQIFNFLNDPANNLEGEFAFARIVGTGADTTRGVPSTPVANQNTYSTALIHPAASTAASPAARVPSRDGTQRSTNRLATVVEDEELAAAVNALFRDFAYETL